MTQRDLPTRSHESDERVTESTAGAGVDRTLIREMLKLTPRQRLDRAVEEARNLSALLEEREGESP